MNESHLMFSIGYFQFQVFDWERKKKELISLMGKRELNLDKTVKTSYNVEVEDYDLSLSVKQIFQDELLKLEQLTGLESYDIDYAWFQEELKHMHHQVHNHGYGISSVCYIDYDSDVHTPLTFIAPYNDPFTGLCDYHTPENIDSGTILFFPSSIHHFTTPNSSDKSRKIVSFNIKPHAK